MKKKMKKKKKKSRVIIVINEQGVGVGTKANRKYRDPGMGMKKHAISGHPAPAGRFTGPKAGKRVRRKGSTRKQRAAKMNSHRSKY